MFKLRGLRWPDNRDDLCALDTSFDTERVYRVVATTAGFTLHTALVSPPLHKIYDLTDEVDRFPTFDQVWIAEWAGRMAGVAALSHDESDQRTIVKHLYIDRAQRRQGIGCMLMETMIARARQWQARYVWLKHRM